MRFVDASTLGFALSVLLGSTSVPTQTLPLLHQQRYCMGTMFDIVAYHSSRSIAEQAVESAMGEIVRLDQVMSHFNADSNLSKLNREGHRGFVSVESSLYEVIEASMRFSRLSGGKFDVTVAPLLRTWKRAHAEGRHPSAREISDARRCVGYEKIEARAPDRIRFRSDCLEIDLGGIGKGYAVDRAVAVLEAAGIRHALINAGSSSIAAIGAPPGRDGWPVQLGARLRPEERTTVSGSSTLLLRDNSISTSQQNSASPELEAGFGGIVDPQNGAPADSRLAVSVVARSATVSDALSTTLLLVSSEDGRQILAQFADASALWISPGGELRAAYRESRLQLADVR
jgi:thiamine biosynthesis lipoprotein